MNVIIDVLQTSGTTYCNSFEAHVFRSSSCVQQVLDYLCMWNTKAEIWTIL